MMSYQYQHRRGARRVTTAWAFAVLVLIVILAIAYCVVQLVRSGPSASASVVLGRDVSIPGAAPKLPWPTQGAAAMSIVGVGSLGGVHTNTAMPLASVTKLITALVILKDKPLRIGQQGPSLTVSAADAAAYAADVKNQDSVLDVRAGERLTELQALEGMLIPSGDNVANILAAWDAGSASGFSSKMNAEAKALGLTGTHLQGASGLSSASVGTASDMVTLGTDVMANPVLKGIVAMPQVTLPVAGLVYNYDYALGTDGIVGIKTGSTTAAGGNFVFAATRKVDGRELTAVGAILGQQGGQPLQKALDVGEALAKAAFGSVKRRTVLAAGRTVIDVHAPWGQSLTGTTSRTLRVLTVPGESVTAKATEAPALHAKTLDSLKRGQTLGTVDVSLGGRSLADPVLATGRLSPPSLSYRLTRS